ncbi:MAG: ATP-binding protein, partial [Mahellales bacterium]
SLVLLLLSGGLLAAGYFINQDLLKLFAGIGLALSTAHLWSWYRIKQANKVHGQRSRDIRENIQRQLQAASDALKRQRQEVLDLLKGIPIVPALLDNPDEILYTGIVNIQQLLEKRADLLREYRSISDCYHKRIRQVERLCGQSMDDHLQMAEQRIMELDERLRALEDSIKVSQGAARELAVQREELKRVESEIEAIKSKRHELHMPLLTIGDGDLDKGLELAQRKKRDYQQYQKIQEDLEREYPDLEDIIKEIKDTPSDDQWIFSDEEIVKAQDREAELTDKLGELQSHEARLNNDITNLNSNQTLDEVDGLLEVLQEQLDRILRKRDRLELLKNIIITSERQFRERHQPDVLKRAGEYLSLITGGRYDTLFFEEQDKEPLLMTKVLDDPYPVPASHPLSRGTLDQIYLSLRLSLMDHLDEGRERLPLSIDEVFVNWDENRLNNGLKVLEKVQAQRQVFIFTCHKWLADMLRDRFDKPVLDLPIQS